MIWPFLMRHKDVDMTFYGPDGVEITFERPHAFTGIFLGRVFFFSFGTIMRVRKEKP